jgi:hypothetical protein
VRTNRLSDSFPAKPANEACGLCSGYYSMKTLVTRLRDAGFRSILVRPVIHSLTLIARRCLSYLKLTGMFEPFLTIESPLNAFLEVALR